MINKISAKREVNGLTITELRSRYFPWIFTKFWWVIIPDSVQKRPSICNLQNMCSEKTLKNSQKNSYFSKNRLQQMYFLVNFSKCLAKFFKEPPGYCFYDLQIYLNRKKTFSKLAIKFDAFWWHCDAFIVIFRHSFMYFTG